MTEKIGTNTGRFPRGPDPRRGVGKAGRSGRKPIRFLAECAKLASGTVLRKIRVFLARADRGPDDGGWRWAAEYVTSYAFSKATPAHPDVAVTVSASADFTLGEHDDARAVLLERLDRMAENIEHAREREQSAPPPHTNGGVP
jgi:hypothetical protein